MTENRNLTAEEWAEFAGVFEKAGVYSPDSVRRFVDTRLNKIYDVFLLNKNLVLKKSDRDKEKFEQYFAGHGFSVPPVISSFQIGDDCWVTMPYIDGTDARDCSPEDAGGVGRELAKIHSYYLGTDTNPERKKYWNPKIIECSGRFLGILIRNLKAQKNPLDKEEEVSYNKSNERVA